MYTGGAQKAGPLASVIFIFNDDYYQFTEASGEIFKKIC